MSIFFDIMVIGDIMNQSKFIELRNKYSFFYYKSYEVIENTDNYEIIYHFEIPGLSEFNPKTTIDKKNIVNNDYDYIDYMAFNMGLVELISYWKCTCSPNVIVEAGYLDEYQINWFRKLYFHGLGEFFYVNGIETNIENFMNLTSTGLIKDLEFIKYNGTGNLIAVGGGKDSVVSLELLKGQDNICFMINPKTPGIECVRESGYDDYFCVKRTIDNNLIELNKNDPLLEFMITTDVPLSSLISSLQKSPNMISAILFSPTK